MMDKNLSWTTSLGGAYMRDSQSLMNAVQEMRARAEQAGNLKSTPQETVTNDGQTIDVEPADAEVVYVPEYDPWFCYGAPILFYPDWVPIRGCTSTSRASISGSGSESGCSAITAGAGITGGRIGAVTASISIIGLTLRTI